MKTIFGRGLCLVLGLLAASAPALANGPVLEAIYVDPPGFGFNDNTPVAPVPGNPHNTRGAQRRAVMAAALDIWATQIDSRVPVRVLAQFEDLGCGEGSFLGFGSSLSILANFSGAPEPGVNYPAALAAHLAGRRLTGPAELRVRFNARVDTEVCFASIPDGFWYGLGKPQAHRTLSAPFLALVLHEIGHGLGFDSFTDSETGTFFGNPPRPSAYSGHLFSASQQRSWRQMSAAERAASAVSEPDLVWTGARTIEAMTEHLLPPGQILIEPAIAGLDRFPALVHGLRPFPPRSGLRARFAVADNGTDTPAGSDRARTDGCQPLTNTSEASNRIVLVTRGGCTFNTKWRHVHDAGAVAVVVADNLEPDAGALARNQQIFIQEAVLIPYWSLSRADGEMLIGDPPQWLTLAYDETQPPVGSNDGKLIMDAKSTLRVSVNVVHPSNEMLPSLLMSSSVGSSSHLQGFLELAAAPLHDLGWPDMEAKQSQLSGNWYDTARSGEGCQLTLEGDEQTWILTCYTYLDGDQVWLLGTGRRRGDRLDFNDVHLTMGADFGTAFDPDDVERIAWGRVRMQILDCNQAQLQFLPNLAGYHHRISFMQKIVEIDCQRPASAQPDRRWSGNWYDPARSGEGIQLAQEGDGGTIVLTYYTYRDGKQLWLIGTGALSGNQVAFNDMHFTRGGDYGPGFDPDAIERIAFGTITLEFNDCNNARMIIAPIPGLFEAGERVVTRIVPRTCP